MQYLRYSVDDIIMSIGWLLFTSLIGIIVFMALFDKEKGFPNLTYSIYWPLRLLRIVCACIWAFFPTMFIMWLCNRYETVSATLLSLCSIPLSFLSMFLAKKVLAKIKSTSEGRDYEGDY